MSRLLIIGGASSDVIHLEGKRFATTGGAGLYTALAAHSCGARVSLFAPRPDPVPQSLLSAVGHPDEWLGPTVHPGQLPHFEIAYHDGKTEYLAASFGAVESLSPETLPDDLSGYDLVHVTPLGNASRQLSFIRACRVRGAGKISAGTSFLFIKKQVSEVRAVIELSDYFFMNDQEARALFGQVDSAHSAPGKVLYITMGAQGARIIQGDIYNQVPAVPVSELDPTGAGDAFCGAVIAYLLQNMHPAMAARHAVPLVAKMIAQVGPAALLSKEPPPEPPLDARVQVNQLQVSKAAVRIAHLEDVKPFPFVSPDLPVAGHPKALEYFFAATLQQFSFWSERDDHYDQPLIASLGGTLKKGSDYLWDAFRRKVEVEPDFCSPERQVTLSRDELLQVFRSDDGTDPMPALDLHLDVAQRYGRDMLALQLTPHILINEARASDRPLTTLIAFLDQIGGYKEDPLRKKSSLLALIVNQRPESFLPLGPHERVSPVIDYHAMRACLRIGLVDVLDIELSRKLNDRQTVTMDEEWAVRYACYHAYEQIVALSGKSYGAVGYYLFSGTRTICHEMSTPQCSRCRLDPVCAHRKDFFQPVMRTTFY